MFTKEKLVDKPFYLIAKFWLGKFEGFIKIGDDEEEITKLFEKRYKCTDEHAFGITEESFSLLKVTATELLNSYYEKE